MTPRDLPPDIPGLGSLPEPDQDPAVAALARTFAHDGETLSPHDRLGELRSRADRGGRRRPALAAAAAALVVAGTALGVGVLGRDPNRPTTPAVPTGIVTTPAKPTPAPTTSPSAPSTPTATSRSTIAVAVPVYYLGQDGDRLALYREFHRHDVRAGAALAAALADATDPAAVTDPGLSTPWGSARTSLSLDTSTPGVVTIHLPASASRANGRTAEQARLAIQQLVWTVTAVRQDAQLGVRLLIGDQAGRLFAAVPVGQVVHRTSPSYDVLGSVWIEAPEPGQRVSGQVTVRGSACTFEASVAWQLRLGGTVVRSGHTTASSGCPQRGTWSVTLGRLAAGSYTFRAFEPPASGQGPDREQTRAFVVR